MFDLTLPRFDLMAQLDKAPAGMTLGELSQRMMVSNGNLTGLTERLVAEGLVCRRASRRDRRVQNVSLSPQGRRAFRLLARAHADWMAEIFAQLELGEIELLMGLLARTKSSVRKALPRPAATHDGCTPARPSPARKSRSQPGKPGRASAPRRLR